jgi:hypothetical protein
MIMKKNRLITTAVRGIVAIVGLTVVGMAGTLVASEPEKSARGGILAKTARHQFEVFFYTTGVRVFALDASGTQLDASRLTGLATFYHPNSPNAWFSRPLHPTASGTAGTLASLELAVGLSNAPAKGGRVAFEISGLSDADETKAAFTVPLEFNTASAAQPAPVVRTSPGGGATVPRYLYGPGYYGYGYYEYTSPGTQVPSSVTRSGGAGVHSYAASPGMYGPDGMTVGAYHRDWSTGRSSPIAKPWLRPMD